MRKDNYAVLVMIITPQRGAATGNEARHAALSELSSQADRIDVWPHEAYFSLRISDAISDGKGATVKAGPKGRGANPRRRAQSASRSCPRPFVQGQPVLRPQGSRPSPLRDGAPSSGRWAAHKQCRRYLRGLTTDFLQSPERFGRPRPRWIASAAARAQGRAQDLSRGDRFRQRIEGRKSRSLATAGYRRDRRSFWPRRPSAKPGAGAHAQKKNDSVLRSRQRGPCRRCLRATARRGGRRSTDPWSGIGDFAASRHGGVDKGLRLNTGPYVTSPCRSSAANRGRDRQERTHSHTRQPCRNAQRGAHPCLTSR